MKQRLTVPVWPVDELVEWADLGPPSRVVRETPWATVVFWDVAGAPSSVGTAQEGAKRAEHARFVGDEIAHGPTRIWGKAVCPGFATECRVLPLLAAIRPDQVLAPIRVEPDRGFLLLPDGGPTLESSVDPVVWRDTILGYAGLQQDLAGRASALLAAGCADLRPMAAVERLAQHMTAGRVDHRPHLVDWLAAVADELSDEITATIQHDDLQPSNVLVDGRVIDWGDAGVGHPFASLLTALMPGTSKRPGTAAERRAIRDAYLASWAGELGLDFGDHNDARWLQEQADLALLIAPIGRIDTWLRAPDAALVQYPDAIDRWLDHLERSHADPRSNAR